MFSVKLNFCQAFYLLGEVYYSITKAPWRQEQQMLQKNFVILSVVRYSRVRTHASPPSSPTAPTAAGKRWTSTRSGFSIRPAPTRPKISLNAGGSCGHCSVWWPSVWTLTTSTWWPGAPPACSPSMRGCESTFTYSSVAWRCSMWSACATSPPPPVSATFIILTGRVVTPTTFLSSGFGTGSYPCYLRISGNY